MSTSFNSFGIVHLPLSVIFISFIMRMIRVTIFPLFVFNDALKTRSFIVKLFSSYIAYRKYKSFVEDGFI